MALEAGYGKRVTTHSIEEVLKGDAPFPLILLLRFISQVFSDENVYFYRAVEEFKDRPHVVTRDEIVNTYVRPGSDREINISSGCRDALLRQQNEVNRGLFDSAQEEIVELVKVIRFNGLSVR